MKNIHLIPTPNPSRLLKTIPKGNLLLAKENIVGSHWENQNIYITSDDEIKERDWCNDFDGKQILQFNNKVSVLLANQQKEKCGIKSFFKIILTTDVDLIADGVQAIDDEFLEWFVKNPSCEEVKLDSICKCTSCGSSVKSSCDYAYKCNPQIFYKIIIPSEEPKQIKCYCGHTTYCDCSPLEKPKEEPTEEAKQRAKNYMSLKGALEPKQETTLEEYISEVTKNFGDEMSIKFTSGGIKLGAKWQQERSYSEEDMVKFAEFVATYLDKNRNVNGEMLHAKSKYDGAERTIDLLQIWFEQFKKK